MVLQLQFKVLHNSPYCRLPHSTLGSGNNNSLQCQKCLSGIKFGVTRNNRLNVAASLRSFGSISHDSTCAAVRRELVFPYLGNGIGRSLISDGVFPKRFSSKATDNKGKKPAKALAARGKDRDVTTSASVSKESLVEGKKNMKEGSSKKAPVVSDKQDTKVTAKKKKQSTSKRSSKRSTTSSSSEEVAGKEVSRKSSKGKKKSSTSKTRNPVVSSSLEEMPIDSGSTKRESKKKSGSSSSQKEQVENLGKFTDKPLYPPTGKSVLVVESVTKAKVIQRYLGDMYEVLPSYGHVRDLAARSGSVRPDDDFSMVWEVPSPAWTHLKSIKVALSGYILSFLSFSCP